MQREVVLHSHTCTHNGHEFIRSTHIIMQFPCPLPAPFLFVFHPLVLVLVHLLRPPSVPWCHENKGLAKENATGYLGSIQL